MKSLNAASCIRFEKKGLKISMVDLPSKQVIWQKSLLCDFEILDNAGNVINPVRTAAFIQKNANELGIPKKVKVSLGLEFVSLNRLVLPPVSGPDFDQIIIDEAERESPFSYTDEKVAVAYQISQNKPVENGTPGTEVFAVTTPQSIIDNIIEVFRNTNLILEAISPSLLGLKQHLLEEHIDISQPFVLVFVTSQNAEFYVWEGQFATSVHFIRFGITEQESLQKEIAASLEHFNRKSNGISISQVVLIGEKCQVELENQYIIKIVSGDEWSDLAGLASISVVSDNLNFITQNSKDHSATPGSNRVWPIIIGCIVLLNIPMGWNLWTDKQQLLQLKKENIQLQELLNIQKKQLNQEKQLDTHYKIHLLLENIREIVTKEIMFERLILNIDGKSMQLEGFCIGQNNINNFIQELSIIEGVLSVEGIQIVEQMRKNLTGYVFCFQVNLKDI